MNLPIGETGIRASVADLFSPALAIFLLATVMREGVMLPAWRIPRLWIWLISLTAVMTGALILGRFYTGTWISWALYNKYAGWFALVWYFVLGGWFASRSAPVATMILVRLFLIFSFSVSLYSIVDVLLWTGFGIDFPEGNKGTRLLGFMRNPNAFGLFVAVTLAVQAPYMAAGQLFSRKAHFFGAVILLVALIFSFSRSSWIGAIAFLICAAMYRGLDVRRFAAAFGVAALAAVFILFVYPTVIDGLMKLVGVEYSQARIASQNTLANLQLRMVEVDDYGKEIRAITYERAFEMWWERPLAGIGLGGFLAPQLAAGAKQPVIIHNTYLWLLTEFGLLGFSAFLVFFAVCIWTLGRDLRQDPDETRLFRLAALCAVMTIMGASVSMEAMYQRHVWFFAGWALALPIVGGGGIRRAEPAA